MKQILLNRLESILVAVGGAVPAPLVPSNFYARSMQLAELILVAIGGTVPPAAIPTNYKQRLLTLLELSLTAEGQTPIPLTPIANFRDRLLTLLGQLLVFGGGSVPALATPTNFEQRLLLLMDGLVVVAPNFVVAPPPMQTETNAYETRVIALGSTLPAGAKVAINAFVVAIKGQSYYAKIKMLWLGAGPSSLAGLGAHLIHSLAASATLAGFSAGDYNRNVAPIGLRGGSSRILNHQFAPNQLSSGNSTIFYFCSDGVQTAGSLPDFCMGPLDASTQTVCLTNFDGTTGYIYFPISSNPATLPVATYAGSNAAFIVGVRDGNRTGSYINGVFQNWGALLTGALPTTGSTYSLYAPAYGHSTRRIALAGCANLFTSAEVTHFSAQVATLISALAAVA
jgi:hypothetical protein